MAGLTALLEKKLSEPRILEFFIALLPTGALGHKGYWPPTPVKKPRTPALEPPREVRCHRHWKPCAGVRAILQAVLALLSVQTNESSGEEARKPSH